VGEFLLFDGIFLLTTFGRRVGRQNGKPPFRLRTLANIRRRIRCPVRRMAQYVGDLLPCCHRKGRQRQFMLPAPTINHAYNFTGFFCVHTRIA
jgi:hypothetical protein